MLTIICKYNQSSYLGNKVPLDRWCVLYDAEVILKLLKVCRNVSRACTQSKYVFQCRFTYQRDKVYIARILLGAECPRKKLHTVDTMKPGQNHRHVTDGIVSIIFMNGRFWSLNKVFAEIFLIDWIDNIRILVQGMVRLYLNQYRSRCVTFYGTTWLQWINKNCITSCGHVFYEARIAIKPDALFLGIPKQSSQDLMSG